LCFGRLADLTGRSRIFSWGFLLFALGSGLCSLAGGIGQLVMARVVESVGAAMMMATSMALATAVFPREERGRALGMLGTVVAIGSMTGPTLGGFLVGSYGWRAIFYLNIVLGIIGYTGCRFILPDDQPTTANKSFDFFGAAVFAALMVALVTGLNAAKTNGFSSLPALLGVGCAGLLLALFLIIEKGMQSPLLDLSIFRDRVFTAGNLAGLLSFVAMFSTNILLVFYMEQVLGYKPQRVGIILLAFPAVMAFVAPLSGWLSDRLGPSILTAVGMGCSALALYGLSRLGISSQMWEIGGLMGLLGFGMGLFQSPNNSAVIGTVAPDKLGIAGGVMATVRNVGMVIGIAWSMSTFSVRYTQLLAEYGQPGILERKLAFVGSISFVFVLAAVICLFGLAASLIRSQAGQGAKQTVVRSEEEKGKML
ncbi:MAG TPA: MFS transporter, partial [Bacillota bacterium]|nr:MFS transporter [Bacillota bacterium]